jgi:peptidyl-prolyl cis-trans isomerase SurA
MYCSKKSRTNNLIGKIQSMNKKWCMLMAACCIICGTSAQTLFTYGSYSADAKDFLRAFNKNNTSPKTNKAKAMKDYLDLYIASRLKIREAYDRGYDTLPQIKNEIQNLRYQVIENYLNDPTTMNKLVHEAFLRNQKDIHIAHIYISFKNSSNTLDTNEALKKINEVYEKLKRGEDFFRLAEEYSSDPSAKTNKGDIGYITVFTLPYEFENIVYDLSPGKFSSPHKSKIGFHIFKNISERKAAGKMKAAQILLAFPPGADETVKKNIALLADSLYHRLLKGDDLAMLSNKFSNDYISAASGGMLPEFTVGQYDPEFENAVFSLQKDGDFTKPFTTTHGYHIVKRISIVSIVTDAKNKANLDDLKLKVSQSDRMQVAKNLFLDTVLKKTSFKKAPFSERDLWLFTDSVLNNLASPIPISLTKQSKLFDLGNKVLSVEDWINYAQIWRFKTDGSGQKPYKQLMDEFIHSQAETYYREHLEDYNEDFRNQMTEFKEGNLFFEIMQQEVWSKAQNDSAALLNYYNDHKNNYSWKQSADAVVFFCSDEATAKMLLFQIKKNPLEWRKISENLGEKVVADSSRYEFSQIPNALKAPLSNGLITLPVKNQTDGTTSFAYVIKTYAPGVQRSFAEAKGLVISDYQAQLEKKWVEALKKKYPVKVNEKNFQNLVK